MGPVALKFDEENRTLGMRQAAERGGGGIDAGNSGTAGSLRARSKPIHCGATETHLPVEFTLLRYKPRPWTPTDTYLISLYMWKTLTSTWKSKLNRA